MNPEPLSHWTSSSAPWVYVILTVGTWALGQLRFLVPLSPKTDSSAEATEEAWGDAAFTKEPLEASHSVCVQALRLSARGSSGGAMMDRKP